MNFDFDRVWKNKRVLRERLARRPVAEKLRLLDAMRERAVTIRAAKACRPTTGQEPPPNYGKQP